MPYLQLGSCLEDYYKLPLRLIASLNELLERDREGIISAKQGKESLSERELPEELLEELKENGA